MITIGIDPGIEKTGIGIIESNNNNLKLIFNKLIHTSSKLSHVNRLKIVYEEILCILDLFKINHASVEKLFFAKNIRTAMSVSEARGVILLALNQKDIPIYEYTPLQVKQALVGYGRAQKNQIQSLVKIILNLDKVPKPDDVADGIALAITHINTYRTLSKIKKGMY